MMTTHFTLEQESQPVLRDPQWSQIEAELLQLDPRRRSFYILSRSDGSYVQIAGASLRLTIEFRSVDGNSFRHFVLGHDSEDQTIASINYSGGAITLQRNEVLQMADALKVFESFIQTAGTPPEYVLRNVTAQLEL